MAPEPSSQDVNEIRNSTTPPPIFSNGGPMISGHKISLNVHYDATDAAPANRPCSVTPLEEQVATFETLPGVHGSTKLNGYAFNDRSDQFPLARENIELKSGGSGVEKVTHVDSFVVNAEPVLSGEHRSASSFVEKARPESPESFSASEPEVEPEVSGGESSQEEHMEEKYVACSSVESMLGNEPYSDGPDQVIPASAIKVWGSRDAIKLRVADKGMAGRKPISVPTMLKRVAQKYPHNKALAVKRNNAWQYWSYSEYYDNVRTVAKAFIKLGLERFHGVCIIGFNSPEWFFSNIGAIFAGGLSAGIYTTNTPEACKHCMINCEAQIVVVEDQKQLDKILSIRDELPHLKTIIQYGGKPTTEGVLSWDQILQLGKLEPDTELNRRLKLMAVNQCCTLIYTSGTTGAPKGVMLSQDNLSWTGYANASNVPSNIGNETIISFLPLSHVAAQLCDIYLPIELVGTVYFAKPDALKGSLGETLKEVRPTKFLGVPRVWEKIYEKMQEVGRKNTGVKKSIATWAKAIGLESNVRKTRNDNSKPFGFSIAQAIVFNKIKQVLGLDRCDMFISAAAPISIDVIQYFHSLNICLTEIYGMSESTGPHTVGTESGFRYGSAGKTVPGCKTMLYKQDADGNGEICMGGRNVCMGYLRMEDKTHEAIDDDGWLHSGDIGSIDEDGFLFITGRLKELIITAGGENIPPVLVEEVLKGELPCISNAMLIGDRRKFLSVLLTLKTNMDDEGAPLDTLSPPCMQWCREQNSNANTVLDIIGAPDVHVMRAIQDGIDRANVKAASNAQKVQKWTILPRDFSVPGNELGPTLKLKRPVVNEMYTDTIERFYE